MVLVQAFLEHRAEGLPDLGVGLGVLVRRALELADDAAVTGLADLRHLRIVLQHLARDVERQILAVDDAAHEAQLGRQQLGIVGDVDAPHVELHAALAVGIEQVERRRRRHEQQHRVGLPALDPVVERHRRLVEGHGDRAIGLRVVLRLELGLRRAARARSRH